MPASTQLPMMLKHVAAALAPPSDPANIQFLRPTTGLRRFLSEALLSGGTSPFSRNTTRVFHWLRV